MTQSAQAQASWSCRHCNSAFGRKEHLERHMRRHLQLKPFRCTLCAESFARKDTLLRHSAVHGERGDELRRHLADQSKRRAQACHNCARSKQRCQGAIPCNRCIKKGITCETKTSHPSSEPHTPSYPVSHDLHGQTTTTTPLNTSTNIAVNADPPETDVGGQTLNSTSEPSTAVERDPSHEETAPSSRLTTPCTEFAVPLQEDDISLPANFDYHTLGQDLADSDVVHYNTNVWSADFSDLFLSPLLWASCPDDINQSDLLAQGGGAQQVDEPSGNNCLSILGAHDPHLNGIDVIPEQMGEIEVVQTAHNVSQRCHADRYLLITPADEEIIACENFCHVRHLDFTSYNTCKDFHAQLQDAQIPALPDFRVMHAFVELYFEYFDKNLPCVHPSQFERNDSSWILLFAVTSVGAQYSALPGANEHVRGLQFLLEQAVKENIPPNSRDTNLPFVQSVLIRDINRSFSGLKSQQMKLEYERNLLFTLQRSLNNTHRVSYKEMTAVPGCPMDDWDVWFTTEAMTRLNLCINHLQVLQFSLFDMKPMNRDFNVTQNSVPLTDRWACRNDEEWTRRSRQSLLDTKQQRFSEVTSLMALISVERIQRTDRIGDMLLARNLQNTRRNSHANSAQAFLWPDNTQPLSSRPGFILPQTDSVLNKWLSDFTIRWINEHSSESTNCFLQIMAILRHVPLRAIYAYSGWEADENEIQEAGTFLSFWIKDNPTSVKTCLWHASSSLRILRSKIQFSCSDAFVVLIAGLFVWTYCKLGPCTDNTDQVMNTQNFKDGNIPIRIDQLSNEVEINAWINGDNPAIHLTGFGALIGPGSAHRVITELDKILRSKIGWRVLRRGLAYNFRQVALGQRPALHEEQDA